MFATLLQVLGAVAMGVFGYKFSTLISADAGYVINVIGTVLGAGIGFTVVYMWFVKGPVFEKIQHA